MNVRTAVNGATVRYRIAINPKIDPKIDPKIEGEEASRQECTRSWSALIEAKKTEREHWITTEKVYFYSSRQPSRPLQ